MDTLLSNGTLQSTSTTSHSNADLDFGFDEDLLDALKPLEDTSKPVITKTSEKTTATDTADTPSESSNLGDGKLRELFYMKNEARQHLKEAAEAEEKLMSYGPNALHNVELFENKKKTKEFNEKLQEAGVDPVKYWRMHETQERAEHQYKKQDRKLDQNHSVLDHETHYRSFKKRNTHVKFSREEYEAQKEKFGNDFYDPNSFVLMSDYQASKMDAMIAEIKEQEKRRENFSRRRMVSDRDDVSFINERNRNFNKKLDRAYDEHTEDLKENLERVRSVNAAEVLYYIEVFFPSMDECKDYESGKSAAGAVQMRWTADDPRYGPYCKPVSCAALPTADRGYEFGGMASYALTECGAKSSLGADQKGLMLFGYDGRNCKADVSNKYWYRPDTCLRSASLYAKYYCDGDRLGTTFFTADAEMGTNSTCTQEHSNLKDQDPILFDKCLGEEANDAFLSLTWRCNMQMDSAPAMAISFVLLVLSLLVL